MITPFKNSYWVIANELLAGEIPASIQMEETEKKLNALINLKIDVVINLMELNEVNNQGQPFYDYFPYLQSKHIECLRFPIKDLSIPTVDEMTDIVDTINHFLSQQKKVYIHCWGGIGRTGTVIGCFLKSNQLSTNQNVLKFIQFLKKDSGLSHRDSPETLEQENFVLNFRNY